MIVIMGTFAWGTRAALAGQARFPLTDITKRSVGLPYDANTEWWNKLAFTTNKKITKVKSNNTKVLKVLDTMDGYLYLQTMKPGKATLTFRLNGKKKTVSIVVKKYKNPFASYKVNGKNYASRFKKQCAGSIGLNNTSSISGKVKITPAKNWQVKRIEAYVPGGGKTFRKVKNGAKLPDGTTTVTAIMVNTKTGVWQRTHLYT